ncbi:MAG: von Willebrand factor type A domain-containing protein [Saprospiraceae bacterium]
MKRMLWLLFTAALVLPAWRMANTYTIEGKVLDEEGQELIGASVLIKGTSIGVVTNINGHFTLASPDSCATIVITYTGYEPLEVKACSGKFEKYTLKSRVTLDEVIVTSPGIKTERRESRSADKAKKDMVQGYSYLPSPATSMPRQPYPEPYPEQNTEDYAAIQENRFQPALQIPLSTFSIDVDAASYSNLRRFLNLGQMPPADAVRIEEMINYFDYDYPQPKGEHPFEVVTELSECPWQPEHRLLHIGLQGKTISTENLPASNLVFLIDVSGSMSAPNKLPLLQSAYKLLVDQLRPKDKVSIVVYAGAAGLVLSPTDGTDKIKIKEAIDKLSAGGSTAGGAGIQLAYKTAREQFVKGGNNRVILATDGDFNVGASSDEEMVKLIEKERESGIFLTVLGFGMGNYKDSKMQQLADKGNGNHAYIDNMSEARKVLVNEFGGTLFTIAKDVKLQIEFNPSKVQAYRLIGYENRMLNKEDFNDDKKDAGELGSGHTVTALYEIIPVGVKSSFIATVDDLKYQKTEEEKKVTIVPSNELVNIKLRYKQPEGAKSQLIEKPVLDKPLKISETSDNFGWSAAVAEFGMLLRKSELKGNATYVQALKLAKNAQGKDVNGYRREMIQLLEIARGLADPELVGKE